MNDKPYSEWTHEELKAYQQKILDESYAALELVYPIGNLT